MSDIVTLVLILIAALVYSLSGYFKNQGQTFDLVKFLVAIVLGFVYGVFALFLGVQPTEADYGIFIATYGFIVVITENVIKGILRRFFGYTEFLK
jgi:drug/metabolite transporter (DMT)-like permease